MTLKALDATAMTHRITADLMRGLGVYYNVAAPTIAVTNASKQANSICGTNRNNTIVTGTLKQERVGGGFRAHTSSTFALDVYACFGATLYHSKRPTTIYKSRRDHGQSLSIGASG